MCIYVRVCVKKTVFMRNEKEGELLVFARIICLYFECICVSVVCVCVCVCVYLLCVCVCVCTCVFGRLG